MGGLPPNPLELHCRLYRFAPALKCFPQLLLCSAIVLTSDRAFYTYGISPRDGLKYKLFSSRHRATRSAKWIYDHCPQCVAERLSFGRCRTTTCRSKGVAVHCLHEYSIRLLLLQRIWRLERGITASAAKTIMLWAVTCKISSFNVVFILHTPTKLQILRWQGLSVHFYVDLPPRACESSSSVASDKPSLPLIVHTGIDSVLARRSFNNKNNNNNDSVRSAIW